ncbi:uncharacterized protein LOC128765065 isoform X4 [Synchiropus splendidus]|uniref:uncharacterized protein LOC128765065 isoform X4 n=1 Tax=Synchiropus splendidus TaxID=270530 RepID=UPI00237E0EF4|nr:uncharacterized protein LOC128765065 isoform X4 [Synchiropus splendidus]
MSSERLLKAFVTERLTAAAEEIADFFGKTIAKYEEEACESQREITRLRSLLMDLASYRKSEEATPEQNQRELEASPCHVTDVELLHIKKESRAAWGSQQKTAVKVNCNVRSHWISRECILHCLPLQCCHHKALTTVKQLKI